MKYANVLRAVAQTPWAIQERKLTEIVAFLELKAHGAEVAEADVRAFAAGNKRPQPGQRGAIAVLPLYGVIGQRMNAMNDMSGGTSTELFGAQFQDALDDPKVGAIVLDIDSPGGTVQGVAELAMRIYKARGTKPIIAVANSLAASAAYWIASACDEIVATPSGEVGSIGVFVVHVDTSEADAADGVKRTIIKAGKYKAEGNPYEPLTAEAKASIQEYVDGYYGMFVGAVARGRGLSVADVKKGYGEGRALRAQDALAAGMVDRIATLDEVLAGLGAKSNAPRVKMAAEMPDLKIAAQMPGSLNATATNGFLQKFIVTPDSLTTAFEPVAPIPPTAAVAAVDPPVPATAALPIKELHMDSPTAAEKVAPKISEAEQFDAFLALAKQNKDVIKGDALEAVGKWRASGATLEQVKDELLAKHRERAVPIVSDVHNRAQDKPFNTFGEQLGSIRRAGMGGPIDPRLIGLNEAFAAASGSSETVMSDGGFLVQPQFATEIISAAFGAGEILKRARKIPIGPNASGLKVNAIDETSRATGSRFGGVQAFWANEADTATAKKPTFRRVTLDLNKLIGLYYATDEVLADTTALEAIAVQGFGEELMFLTEDAIVNGTGAGQPLGILNAGCLVVQGSSAGGANTVKIADVVGMWSRLMPRSLSSAVWLINQSVWPQLIQLTISGIPAFVPAAGPGAAASVAGAPFGTLLGRPIIPVEYCAQLGTQGDIILADLSTYMLIDKGGPQTAQSIHVRFVNDETAFRFTYRVDGKPYFASAITQYKGSNSQSPFIAFTSTRT